MIRTRVRQFPSINDKCFNGHKKLNVKSENVWATPKYTINVKTTENAFLTGIHWRGAILSIVKKWKDMIRYFHAQTMFFFVCFLSGLPTVLHWFYMKIALKFNLFWNSQICQYPALPISCQDSLRPFVTANMSLGNKVRGLDPSGVSRRQWKTDTSLLPTFTYNYRGSGEGGLVNFEFSCKQKKITDERARVMQFPSIYDKCLSTIWFLSNMVG